MSSLEDATDVVLVSMPFLMPDSPSIQLGILKALLDREGVRCETRSYHVAFLDHLMRASPPDGVVFSVGAYMHLCGGLERAAEWVFKDGVDDAAHERFLAYLETTREDAAYPSLLAFVKTQVPAFIEACCADVLRSRPRVVGFSTTFSQTLGSVALARAIKRADPTVKIVFGGANCDGPMGPALLRAFPVIDVVVRGEGEPVLPTLARELVAGQRPTPLPGLCFRLDGREVEVPQTASVYPMNDVPTPHYDEFFETVDRSCVRSDLRAMVRVPVESARGCWWGAKQHCTFCGLNGGSMAFRSKSADLAHHDIIELSRRYRALEISSVDNIIDMKYVRDLLPRIRDDANDFRLFFETKSNLKRSELQLMRDAGVYSIQPGIESLSTPILRLMKKGVTALQNIRLLKWCAELGIVPHWNVIYGFPREPAAEYARMAKLVESLVHLPPPNTSRLTVQRFSPFHSDAAGHGLELVGPQASYRHLYDVDSATLADLAYMFDYRHADGRNPGEYTSVLESAVETWRTRSRTAAGPLLFYMRGPDFLQIIDRRTADATSRLDLEGPQVVIFTACDAGARVPAVVAALHEAGHLDLDEDDVRDFLEELREAGIVYEEDGRYLTLPVYPDAIRARMRPSAGLGAPRVDEERTRQPETRPLVQLTSRRRSSHPLA